MAQLDITSTFRWEGKNGALIATNGLVDTTGTIPISQLPDGFMDLISFWNASTNVPYLYNSIGKKGDVYKCNFAGSVDFGAGVISFLAGDLVYYDGFIWGKISANSTSSIFAINTYSFTATAGQTVYNLTYLPNQVSVYYNGSKLTKTQYNANGGSYITLLFSPIAGDIITVDAYVNTLGLGGGGTAGSIAKWLGTSTLANAVAGTDYVLPAALNAYVPTFRSLTINGTTYDLTADRSWSINPMVYPSAGIAVSTGSAWGTSIVDNSTNWNTAYTNRITSLTTTGSSGAATLSGNVLNIPNYGSVLSSYVPYTGATADLNLGSRNLYVNNIFDGFSSITASGTQVVLTVSSVPSYYVNGSGGQTIKLPNATTLQNGAVYVFNNNQSSGAITVNNNSNTLVVSIPSGGYCTLELNDNSIAAGSWDRHFLAPSNVSWSTNTFDYAGSITSATWNGNVIAINRGGTGSSTQNFVDLSTTQTIGGAKTFSSALTASSLVKSGGTSSQYLMADGSVSTLSNPITGTGTTNTLPKFTGTSTIGNSNISDSGSLVTISSALTTTADALINGLTVGRGGGNINTNTSIGVSAGSNNTTGTGNTFLGSSAGQNNTTGIYNTFIGREAGLFNTTGDSNTVIGWNAFRAKQTGGDNIALGLNAGRGLGNDDAYTINSSIFIGVDTRASANNQSNQIVIGYGTTGLGSNTTIIGNSSTTATAIYGNLLLGTTTNAGFKLDVNGTSRFQGTGLIGNAPSYFGGRSNIGLSVMTYVDNSAISIVDSAGTSLHVENADGTINSYANISIRTDGGGGAVYSNISLLRTGSATGSLRIHQQGIQQLALFTSGNLLLQNGGTFTDAGYRLDVNGTARVQDTLAVGIAMFSSNATLQVSSYTNYGAILKISDTSSASGIIILGDGNTTLANVGIWRGAANNLTYFGNSLNLGSFSDMIFAVSSASMGNQSERMRITSSGGNVLIGTTTDIASSKLTVQSTTQGVLFPRMTTTEKNAISSPATGLIVFDTTIGKLCVFATTWQTITSI